MHHHILDAQFASLAHCADLLVKDNCIVLPTETVYGLAANALSSSAVAKIYAVKNRPQFNPLIVHVKDSAAAQQIALISEDALKLAEAFWPGPLTLVVPLKPHVGISPLVTAGLDTVAIRCPAHPVFQAILHQINFPLAAPSANPSQYLSATSVDDVCHGFQHLDHALTMIDGGTCASGLESTILDTTTNPMTILRAGPITLQQLHQHTAVCVNHSDDQAPILKAPGMMLRHYAPRTPIRLNATNLIPGEVGLNFGDCTLGDQGFSLNLSVTSQLTEAAHNLFNFLHELDKRQAVGIAVAPIPHHGIGIAINDRLKRAAAQV